MSTTFRAALPALLLLAGCSDEEDALVPQQDTANMQLALADPHTMVAVGDLLFVLVNESEQGDSDLNGDLDKADNVVFMVDTVTGTRTNLGLSSTHNMATDGNTIAWVVSEEDEADPDGGGDLNNDGDFADSFLAVFNPANAVGANNPRVFATAPVEPTLPIAGHAGYYAFVQFEILTGVDLSGDGGLGDLSIGVLEVADGSIFQTGVAANPGAVAFQMDAGLLVFTASEIGSAVDFNGDGALDDVTLFIHRLGSTGSISVPHAIHPLGFTIAGTAANPFVAYAVSEAGDAANYNATSLAVDLDMVDFVCAIYDVGASGGNFTPAAQYFPGNGIAIQPQRLFGSSTRLAMAVPEEDNGFVAPDLNEDIDATDVVPYWVDLEEPGGPQTAHAVGVAMQADEVSPFPHVCGEYLFFLADEAAQGFSGTNYNQRTGDADFEDTCLFFVDMSSPGANAISLEIGATQLVCPDNENPDWVVAVAPEALNGDIDFNFDGDSADEVFAYFPISEGGVVDTTLRIALGGATSNSIINDCPNMVTVFSYSQEGTGLYFGDMNRDLDEDDIIATVQTVSKTSGRWGEEFVLGTVDSVAAGGDTDGEADDDQEAEAIFFDEFPFPISGSTFAFPALEGADGLGIDHNGDGDRVDSVLFVVTVDCE